MSTFQLSAQAGAPFDPSLAGQFPQADPSGTQQCTVPFDAIAGNEISYYHVGAARWVQQIEIVITAIDWLIKQKATIDAMSQATSLGASAPGAWKAGKQILTSGTEEANVQLAREINAARQARLVAAQQKAAAEAADQKLAAQVAQQNAANQAAQQSAAALAAQQAATAAAAEQRLVAVLKAAVKVQASPAERAANKLVNKIVYNLHVISENGGNPAQALEDAIANAGFKGRQAKATYDALIKNLQTAEQDGIFKGAYAAKNTQRMAGGGSPVSGNNQTLEPDHIVPLKEAPEVGNVLANLLYTPKTLNASVQNDITEGAYYYARMLQKAGFLKAARVRELGGKIVWSKPGYKFKGTGQLKPPRGY